ncbi:hypothetical protein NM688_g3270 [Phlebia brevispora]|uniref:Uncharacterized protein n=1 Tax=Phlebia brevispora TaxID=194682 RepID=A0ACC1T648_9APHY|nr:hypothetical protein NM688_g3270 [Phlebia brevispora]
MSERRPLLSASPRQSVEDFTQWTRTKSQKVNTKSEWSFDASDPVISDLPPTQDLPDTRPEWKGVIECPLPPMQYLPSPSTSVQVSPIPDTPALKESPKGNGNAVKVHDCGVSMSNEQDKRVWISADNRDRWCGERHRTLVLCFDGTGDQFDDDNSNIVQLLAMLRKDDNAQQLVYYQAGLGTYTDPMLKTPIASVVSMTLDQMIAWNLGSHVKDGYAFLMQNYTRGDKICIFGFSRGAYTARALAGMLQKVGLLPTCNHQQLPFAYEMYKREDKQGLDMSHAFKKTYSRAVTVDFLGVW